MRALRLTIALLVVACGDDSGNAPGTELGPCVQQQFCESPLQCFDGICVSPDQIGDTGSASDSASASTTNPSTSTTTSSTSVGETSMSTTTSATTAVDETGGTPEVHCTHDDVGCICGHSADFGPPGVACSTSTLPSPASCCANEGWPAYGGCSCWTLSCRQLDPEICYCGLGPPDPEDTPVSSCAPAPSFGGGGGTGVCCLDGGFSCTCYTGLTQCLEGDVQVGSCSTESIGCSESQSSVGACN